MTSVFTFLILHIIQTKCFYLWNAVFPVCKVEWLPHASEAHWGLCQDLPFALLNSAYDKLLHMLVLWMNYLLYFVNLDRKEIETLWIEKIRYSTIGAILFWIVYFYLSIAVAIAIDIDTVNIYIYTCLYVP